MFYRPYPRWTLYLSLPEGHRRELDGMKNAMHDRRQRDKERVALQQAAVVGLEPKTVASTVGLGSGPKVIQELEPAQFTPGDIVDAFCTPVGAAAGTKEFIRGEVRRHLMRITGLEVR